MKVNQLKAGAILSYISILITIIIALLYTPIMIRFLGQSEYGLYAMIGSVSAYLSIMDLGLGNAIVRYVARNRSIGDKESEARLNGMFLFLYSIIGVMTVFVGVLLYNSVQKVFGTSLTTIELEKAKIMIIILIINFAISFPLSIFGSIMQAYERFIAVKFVGIIRTIMNPIITLPFLFLGYGSIVLVLISTIINILCLVYNVYYSFRYLKIKFYFGNMDFRLLKEILGYSFFIFLNVIVDQIYWQTDQVILGVVEGTSAVAVYAIAMRFVSLYMQISNSFSGLFLPKASMMVANKASNADFTLLMAKFGRVQSIILLMIIGGFILYGQPFVNLWAGENYSQAYIYAVIVMVPLTIPLIQNLGLSILQAKNLYGFRTVVYLFIAIINIIISIPLAMKFGGYGTAVATTFSLIMGHIIIMNIYYHRRVGINILYFWKELCPLLIPFIISLSIGYALNFLFIDNSILFLTLKVVLFSVIFVATFWLFGFNNYEKELFLSMINKFFAKTGIKKAKEV